MIETSTVITEQLVSELAARRDSAYEQFTAAYHERLDAEKEQQETLQRRATLLGRRTALREELRGYSETR